MPAVERPGKDGTLKEWAWPTLKVRYSHRHISHLYGAWPRRGTIPLSITEFTVFGKAIAKPMH
jgi:alpha-L-fucosidase 2